MTRYNMSNNGNSGNRDVVHKLHLDLPDRMMNSTSGFVHTREIWTGTGPTPRE